VSLEIHRLEWSVNDIYSVTCKLVLLPLRRAFEYGNRLQPQILIFVGGSVNFLAAILAGAAGWPSCGLAIYCAYSNAEVQDNPNVCLLLGSEKKKKYWPEDRCPQASVCESGPYILGYGPHGCMTILLD